MNVALRMLMRGGAAAPLTYSAEVLADSPGLYWRLGEAAAASTAADASGNSRTGSYGGTRTTGVTGLVSGDADTAMSVSSAGYVARTREAWMDTTTFTAEAIVKQSNTSSYRAVVVCDGIGGSRFWNLYILNGQLHLFNNGATLTGSSTLTVNTAYHVALVSDGSAGTTKLFLNGVLDATGGALGAATGSTRVFDVGASVAGNGSIGTLSFHFAGVIDEVAWYPTALSAARLLAHADAAGY